MVASIPIEGHAVNAAFNPSTNRVYVRTMQATRRGGVAVIDTTSNAVVDVFAVADTATDVDVAVNPATNHVYVPLAGLGAVWVTQDPSAIGGRDFGISLRPEGVRLSWSPGTRETGYSIARWGADTGTMEMLPASGVLPAGTRTFTDSDSLTESGYLYALLPRAGGAILWMSDLVGLWTDVPPTPFPNAAPADFMLRHGRHGHMIGQVGYAMVMTWRAPAVGSAGYVIVGSDSVGTSETVVAAAETRAIDLAGWPKCYTVFADNGALAGYTPTLCAVSVSGLEP
jgi:hypothetical protein